MKKPYTIIAFFSVGDGRRDECWIANFTNKKDAFKCFKQKVEETGSNHYFDNDKDMKEEFNALISTGSNFDCYDTSMIFVRHETCHDTFVERTHRWD